MTLSQEITERVAKVIYEANPIAHWPPADNAEREYWLAAARAAEAIVIEECARRLEELGAIHQHSNDHEAVNLPAAIRALKDKTNG